MLLLHAHIIHMFICYDVLKGFFERAEAEQAQKNLGDVSGWSSMSLEEFASI